MYCNNIQWLAPECVGESFWSPTVNYTVLKMLYTTIKEFYLDHTSNLFYTKIKGLICMIQSIVKSLFFWQQFTFIRAASCSECVVLH